MVKDPNDAELFNLVVEVDRRLDEAGMGLHQRLWHVPIEVTKMMGYPSFSIIGIGAPPVLDRARDIFKSLYKAKDLCSGGSAGVFMFRGSFARIDIPIIFGRASITPLNQVEMTSSQRHILSQDSEQFRVFMDVFIDLLDFHYGIAELRQPASSNELVVRYLSASRQHLHAASSILIQAVEKQGAIQPALLASELALKAGAAANLYSDEKLKGFGHKLHHIASALGSCWPKLDESRIQQVISRMPSYVGDRYSGVELSDRDLGNCVLGAQYICAEVTRQMSDRSFRSSFPEFAKRHFPKM